MHGAKGAVKEKDITGTAQNYLPGHGMGYKDSLVTYNSSTRNLQKYVSTSCAQKKTRVCNRNAEAMNSSSREFIRVLKTTFYDN